MKRLLKEYRVELIIFLSILFGIFLLVEQVDITLMIYRIARRVGEGFDAIFNPENGILVTFLLGFTLSDIIGWSLLVVAMGVVVWRTRWRFENSRFWGSRECPKCGQPIRRTHRTRMNHFWSKVLILKAHRYRCVSSTCGWSGLRKPGRHHKRKEDILGDVEQL